MLNFKSNPAYQNTAEFIAAILGIRGLRQLGISIRNISLRGDSITALKWAESGKFKGELVGNAAIIFILQGIYENISVSKVTHLSAEDNWRSDYLSRGGTIVGLKKLDKSLGNPITINTMKLYHFAIQTYLHSQRMNLTSFGSMHVASSEIGK